MHNSPLHSPDVDDITLKPSLAAEIPQAALGPYGDVPAAIAVFRVVMDDDEDKAVDACYEYVSPGYCTVCNCDAESLVGKSVLEFADDQSETMLAQCYRAVMQGETFNNIMYSTLACDWISYNIAPSNVPGCCTFAFVVVDDESRGRKKMAIGGKTSRLITESLKALDGENSYETAINGLLELIAKVIHPTRLCIFERSENATRCTFEWCDAQTESSMGGSGEVSDETLAEWYETLAANPMMLVPDASTLQKFGSETYELLAGNGVRRLIAIPFFSDGDIVGFLKADDYRLDRRIDLKRLLSSVSSFVGARIAIRRLIDNLEWAGVHDGLTHLLNRPGIDSAIEGYRRDCPGQPYVLALIDLDNFKRTNDVHGHAAGDEALQAMARRMRAAFPEHAVLGRNGGDEFLVALLGPAVDRADESLAAFAAEGIDFQYAEKSHHLTISLGYAVCPEDSEGHNELYTKADVALYAVKLEGKSGCKRYAPGMGSKYRARLGFTPRDLAENIPAAMLVYQADEDGTILFAGNELVQMFGCSDMLDFLELTKGTFWGMVHPDDRNRVREEFAQQVVFDDIGSKSFSNFRVITKEGIVKNVFESGRLVDLGEIGKTFYALMIDWAEYDSKMILSKAARGE